MLYVFTCCYVFSGNRQLVKHKSLRDNQHLDTVVSMTSRVNRLVRATFTCLREITVHHLFTTRVHPRLEYANSIWYIRIRRDKVEVETIQRNKASAI